ncbi:MAG: hypothetical protein ACXWJB_11295 [Limisphaerales bacterium]
MESGRFGAIARQTAFAPPPPDVPPIILIPQPKTMMPPMITAVTVQARTSQPNPCAIKVAEDFKKAHPLIKQSRVILNQAITDKFKRVKVGYLHQCVDVKVSKPNVRRALLILDALIHPLEKLGHKFAIGKESRDGTYFTVGQEHVRVLISEKVDQSENQRDPDDTRPSYMWDRYEFTPTGRLIFTIDEYVDAYKKHWSDKANKPLEFQLDKISNAILEVGEALRLRRANQELENQRRIEELNRRAEEERKKLQQEAQKKLLVERSGAWTQSRQVCSFIDECERELLKLGAIAEDSPAANWLRWARAHARSLDPLQSGYLGPLVEAQRTFLASVGQKDGGPSQTQS